MSVATVSVRRWTCDRCKTTADVPDGLDDTPLPDGWGRLDLTIADMNTGIHSWHLCSSCQVITRDQVVTLVGQGKPKTLWEEVDAMRPMTADGEAYDRASDAAWEAWISSLGPIAEEDRLALEQAVLGIYTQRNLTPVL